MALLYKIALIVFILLLLLIESNIQDSDYCAPWNITNYVWLFVLIMFFIYGNLLYPLGHKFIFSLFLWLVGFNVGSIVVYHKTDGTSLIRRDGFNSVLFTFIWIISLILASVFIYKVYKSIGSFYLDMFMDMRQYQNEGMYKFGGLNRILPITQAIFIISLFFKENVGRLRMIISLLITLLMAISIVEKGSLLFVIIVVLYYLCKENRMGKMHLLIILFGILIAFYGINTLRQGVFSESSFECFFAVNVLSPSVAFETLTPCSSPQVGSCTFPPLYILINYIFGTDYSIVLKLKDFVYAPVPTNVFTIMQPFYEDFGSVGVIVFGFLFGGISGYIYKKSLSGNRFMTCLYTYVLYCLVVQFFQENFFVSISYVLQLCLVFFLVNKTSICSVDE